MRAVGIVAEYDPFHLGHQYHIEETKKLLGRASPVVCVMSGSWGQRGTCTLTDKWTRTLLALRGGVDLVLELPVWYALSSAEGFARGAVGLLAATGVVDVLSFGSECGDIKALKCLATCLNSSACRTELRRRLQTGKSFATCRQEAVTALAGEDFSALLTDPNNNLGVEYLRALHTCGQKIRPMTVQRKGSGHHDTVSCEGFASASHVRMMVRRGDWSATAACTPVGTVEVLQQAGLADLKYVERAVLAQLRLMGETDFAALPDSGATEGLPARLVRAARQAENLETFYSLSKTRRYAHARLRRLTIRAFLGVPHIETALYLRVLGMTARGRTVLHEIKRVSSLPILTKTAHVKKLCSEIKQQFEIECRATDLYGLCFARVRPCGLDYTMGPVILQS